MYITLKVRYNKKNICLYNFLQEDNLKLNKTNIILLFALIMTLFLCAGSAFAYEVDDMQIMDKNVQLSSSDDGGDNGVQSNIFDTNLKSDVESSNLKLGENSNDLMDSSINAKSGAQSQSTLGDSADDSQNFEIYQHSHVITYVFDDDTKISNETYRVIGTWHNGYFYGTGNPFLMNDTTWTVCLDSNACDPEGSGIYNPGIYRRITLSDNDKFINKYTGEDVYKYLRTYLYLNYNKDIIGYHDNGKAVLSDYLIWAFMEQDYTNPNSYYNRRPFGGKEVYEYVKEIMDIVDSGNGVSSSGPFNNSDFLTYQFYLYGADLEENHVGYQALLGFNILTKINVTKVWDDDDNSAGTRPDSISVQLYGNNETIGKAVVLDDANNWTYSFKDLPVYYLYNMSFKLNKEDFSVKTTYEEDKACDVTVRKVWDESYTGEKPENIVIYLYANGILSYGVELSEADNWEYTFKVLNKYDSNGNEITYSARDMTSGSIGQVETTVKDAKIKNLHFQIINDDLKNESWYIEIRDTAIAGAELLNSTNDWSFDIIGLSEDASEDDFTYYYMYNNPHVNVVDYKVKELNPSKLYVSKISSSQEHVNPLMPTKDQVENERQCYLDKDVTDLKTNFTISNKLETVNITVKKIWNDKNDKDGKRPGKITVHLLANGVVVKTVTISGSEWTYTFTNLPKYDNGSLIKYSVNEESVEGYNSSISSSNNTFTITNTHIPEENKTENKTVPKKEHPKKDIYKVPASKAATGNPFLALIFAIITLIISPKRKN